MKRLVPILFLLFFDYTIYCKNVLPESSDTYIDTSYVQTKSESREKQAVYLGKKFLINKILGVNENRSINFNNAAKKKLINYSKFEIHHIDASKTTGLTTIYYNIREKNYFDLIQIEFFEILENDNLNERIKVLSNFQSRKNQLENKIKSIKKDKNLSAQEKRFELKKLDKRLTLGDLPFDAIIIASEGNKLLEILSHLAFYDINTKNTLIYGTGLWENTEKKETVYENSFFATDIKSPSTEFVQDYKINFSKSPSTAIFHLADLIEFVKDFKRSELSYPEGKIYNGKFSNSVLRDGLFLREVYIKKINKNSLNNITSCSTDVL